MPLQKEIHKAEEWSRRKEFWRQNVLPFCVGLFICAIGYLQLRTSWIILHLAAALLPPCDGLKKSRITTVEFPKQLIYCPSVILWEFIAPRAIIAATPYCETVRDWLIAYYYYSFGRFTLWNTTQQNLPFHIFDNTWLTLQPAKIPICLVTTSFWTKACLFVWQDLLVQSLWFRKPCHRFQLLSMN